MNLDGEALVIRQNGWKRKVAEAAVEEVVDGATIGLGAGSTSEQFILALAGRVKQGLRVRAVAASMRSAALARELGIPLAQLDAVDSLDMSFDGADEVTLPSLGLIKGRGGALLREKLVALASRRRVILVDTTKIVPALGAGTTIPVEVEVFGWRHTAARLASLGGQVIRRPVAGAQPDDPDAEPFITDGGNYTLDLRFETAPQPAELAARLKAFTGVVDHGLFLGITERLYVGDDDGVRIIDRQ